MTFSRTNFASLVFNIKALNIDMVSQVHFKFYLAQLVSIIFVIIGYHKEIVQTSIYVYIYMNEKLNLK